MSNQVGSKLIRAEDDDIISSPIAASNDFSGSTCRPEDFQMVNSYNTVAHTNQQPIADISS